MDLYLYELWDFNENDECNEDDEELEDDDTEETPYNDQYYRNKTTHLEVVRIQDVLPLINGFYECSNLITVYPYSEIGKFGNAGHIIQEDGTYIKKDKEYGVFLPFQNKTLAKEAVYKGLMKMNCPIAANAVMENDVYQLRRTKLFNWNRTSTAYAKKCDKALSDRISKGLCLAPCDKDDCVSWENGTCSDDVFHGGVCTGYFRYDKLSSYQNEFWKYVIDKDEKCYRKLCLGYKLEVNGMIFYTDCDIRQHAVDKAYFWEEKTGRWANLETIRKIAEDNEYRDKILEALKKEQSIMNYPEKPTK